MNPQVDARDQVMVASQELQNCSCHEMSEGTQEVVLERLYLHLL
jgi:hypothetical protein